MTTLLLVRHGETDWNFERRWQGHSDTPLNERGRDQARTLADSLPRVDVIYSSDLARARETAEIIGEQLGVDVRLDERLRERSFGAWEGLLDHEVPELFPELFERWSRNESHGPDDAEPYDAFCARVESFLADVVDRHAGQDVLVVAHGGSVRVIHALAAGIDFVKDRHSLPFMDNCAVSRCAIQEGKLTRLD